MIILGLGANLDSMFGAPEETIRHCVEILPEHGIKVIAFSSIWKTAPVPVSDQPWYKNAVCMVETNLMPSDLLQVIKGIEHEFGRVRTVQNAPRVIDLDILCYNNLEIADDNLQLPHPRMHERAFVLYPLREVAPNWMHPVSALHIDALINDLPSEQEIELL